MLIALGFVKCLARGGQSAACELIRFFLPNLVRPRSKTRFSWQDQLRTIAFSTKLVNYAFLFLEATGFAGNLRTY